MCCPDNIDHLECEIVDGTRKDSAQCKSLPFFKISTPAWKWPVLFDFGKSPLPLKKYPFFRENGYKYGRSRMVYALVGSGGAGPNVRLSVCDSPRRFDMLKNGTLTLTLLALLTNPSMDEKSRVQLSEGWNQLCICKLQRLQRWSLWMHK